VLNIVALVFAGVLVAGVAVLVGTSNAGPGVALAAGELQKLSPAYWPRVEAHMQYHIVQAPSLVGPAWTPEQLPGVRKPTKPKKPSFLMKPLPPPPAPEPPSQFQIEQDLLDLPGESADRSGCWADSPSPLGRTGTELPVPF
jgi:hypothetical protein